MLGTSQALLVARPFVPCCCPCRRRGRLFGFKRQPLTIDKDNDISRCIYLIYICICIWLVRIVCDWISHKLYIREWFIAIPFRFARPCERPPQAATNVARLQIGCNSTIRWEYNTFSLCRTRGFGLSWSRAWGCTESPHPYKFTTASFSLAVFVQQELQSVCVCDTADHK